jgi:ketosteroid isomerase-like protein
MSEIERRLDEVERGLRGLADREAIRELTAQYCHGVVQGSTEAVVSLFTDDASLKTHFPGTSGQANVEPQGKEQLLKEYADLDRLQLQPCIHNHIIELDGDAARGVCSVEIRLVQDGVAYTGAGHYHDEYRRDGERWKFQRRELFVYHWVPLSEGWA